MGSEVTKAVKPGAVIERELPSSGSYSFDQIQRMAVSFAKSGLFGVKDTDQALALMLYAQASGRHPALVMRDYDIIQNRLAKKSEAMLRDFQASGGRVEWTKYADDGVTGVFSHPLSPTPITIDWNMARAEKAGLAGKQGDMYKKFSRQMFRSRCISEGVRTCAPDATEQMYTPDEIRAIEIEMQPVAENTAVAEAAATDTQAHSKEALTREQVDALVDSMDVKTMDELTAAFGTAWTAVGKDKDARKRLKSVYDSMKESLEQGAI
jgi:hypothetical protein